MQISGNKVADIIRFVFFGVFLMTILQCRRSTDAWQPIDGPLMTRWAKEVSPKRVHGEYPRPQMVRKEWQNLNGLWDYSILPKDQPKPGEYEGKILVPFPVESALSGVSRVVGEGNRVWYRRMFGIKKKWRGRRILLHFGGVDWESTVWINGKEMGSHRGGYDPINFDITDALTDRGEQEIVISVWDPVDTGTQPRGKQVKRPRGIWYTSVTGIWQTVWMEPVQESYISHIKIVPDLDKERVRITPDYSGVGDDYEVKLVVKDDGKIVRDLKMSAIGPFDISMKNPKHWSPDSPFLYDLEIILTDEEGKTADRVTSYFGMRKISLGKDDRGITRLMLNNEFVFQFGPLDQGWWPDGLYTAPTDDALRYDIEVTRQLGCNMARKHVKIEPERWYYWCDKLGLLVWQDMPSGDRYIGRSGEDIVRGEASARQFEKELTRLITHFGNHPSIVMWVPFNEGWGQYDTPRIVDLIKEQDPSRLVNNASGWADREVGDVHDIHAYPGPAMPEPEEKRAIVLGEFGGLGLPLEGHTWQDKDNWGYRNYKDVRELTHAYAELIRKLETFKPGGLSAAVYTQTTDVEIEVNGLMTYDRIIKMDPDEVCRINQGYLPPIIEARDDIFLESLKVELTNVSQTGEIRYTLDGSEPTDESALYKTPITITETSTVKARTSWSDGIKSGMNEAVYEKVRMIEPEQVRGLRRGLYYAYYENDGDRWSQLPDFSQLELKVTGRTRGFDLRRAQREDDYGLVFEGFIDIQTDGVYTFYTNSDDGTQLFIHSKLVVDNDSVHGMREEKGQIALRAGKHPIRVTFFQGMGGKGLEVSYKGPGIVKQEIPAGVILCLQP